MIPVDPSGGMDGRRGGGSKTSSVRFGKSPGAMPGVKCMVPYRFILGCLREPRPKGEVGDDAGRLTKSALDDLGGGAGEGNLVWGQAARGELGQYGVEQGLDEARVRVADHGADADGFGGGFADDVGDGRGEIGDKRELGGALVQITARPGGRGRGRGCGWRRGGRRWSCRRPCGPRRGGPWAILGRGRRGRKRRRGRRHSTPIQRVKVWMRAGSTAGRDQAGSKRGSWRMPGTVRMPLSVMRMLGMTERGRRLKPM
jgi:hypothetical protein